MALVLLSGYGLGHAAGQENATLTVLSRSQDLMLPSHDAVALRVRVHWPSYLGEGAAAAQARGHPVLLATHGWAEDLTRWDARARELVLDGYVVVVYDSRGFGESGGLVGLNGPNEQADARWLIDWIAAWPSAGSLRGAGPQGQLVLPPPPEGLPVLAMDATGDPRLGMFGASYAGGIQLLVAPHDARIDAIVPEITWTLLNESLAPGGVVKRVWLDLLFFGGAAASQGADRADPDTEGLDPSIASWYTQVQATGRLPPDAFAALENRSSLHDLPTLRDRDIEVMWHQGWADTLFPATEAIVGMQAIDSRFGHEPSRTSAGASVGQDGTNDASGRHLVLFSAGHGHRTPPTERAELDGLIRSFFAQALRDEASEPIPRVLYSLEENGAPAFRAAASWPLPQAMGRELSPVAAESTAGSQDPSARLLMLQTPAPTTHTEVTNFEDEAGSGASEAPAPTWARYAFDPGAPGHYVGVPRLRLSLTPSVEDLTLFFTLERVDAQGDSKPLGGHVDTVRVEGRAGAVTELDVALTARAFSLAVGERVAVRVATSDTGFFGAREAGTLELEGSSLRLSLDVVTALGPVWVAAAPAEAPSEEEGERETPLGAWVSVLAVLLATIVIRGRRREA